MRLRQKYVEQCSHLAYKSTLNYTPKSKLRNGTISSTARQSSELSRQRVTAFKPFLPTGLGRYRATRRFKTGCGFLPTEHRWNHHQGSQPARSERKLRVAKRPKLLALPVCEWPTKSAKDLAAAARENIGTLQKKRFVTALTRAKTRELGSSSSSSTLFK